MRTDGRLDDVHGPEPNIVAKAGTWYVDRSLTHGGAECGTRLRVVAVLDADTLRIEDDMDGGARVVNRLIFESQMRLESTKPKRHAIAAKPARQRVR